MYNGNSLSGHYSTLGAYQGKLIVFNDSSVK